MRQWVQDILGKIVMDATETMISNVLIRNMGLSMLFVTPKITKKNFLSETFRTHT